MADLYADAANIPYRAENAAVRTRDRGIRFAIFDYTFTGAEQANDIIHFGLNPEKGAEVLTRLGRILTRVTAATALTIDVGDDDVSDPDPDRYADGLDVATADDDIAFGEHTYFVLTARSEIYATIATIDTPVAGGKLRFYIPYLCA